MKEQITYDIFDKVDIRVGTVISVKKWKARKPSLVIQVDFGEDIGIKQSSAQITHYYNEDNLKGKQVIGVCNFPEKYCRVISQVLILGSIDKDEKKKNLTIANLTMHWDFFNRIILHCWAHFRT